MAYRENPCQIGARILSDDQLLFFRNNGYLVLERIVPDDWLDRLRSAADIITGNTGRLSTSTRKVALGPGHSARAPKPSWVWNPDEDSDDLWTFLSDSLLADAVADLIGPDLRFSYSFLFFRRAGGVYAGDGCGDWHQDYAYFPHTNLAGLYVGIHLEDATPECSHTVLIPGSHRGGLFEHMDAEGRFTGRLARGDHKQLALDSAVSLTPPAGSIEIFDLRTVHNDDAGATNEGPASFQALYTAADAFPYRDFKLGSANHGSIVRGRAPRRARHATEGCPGPRDLAEIELWLSGGFTK
jgi:ectoine hydroxylase